MSNLTITASLGSPAHFGAITEVKAGPRDKFISWLLRSKERGELYHGAMSAAEFAAATDDEQKADKKTNWYSVARYKTPKRDRANFAGTAAITFDVEGVDFTRAELEKRLAGFDFAAVSSYSHRLIGGEYRWRVIVFLAGEIIDAEHYEAVRTHINSTHLHSASTENAKDVSRLNYLPGCPRDAVDLHESFHHAGALFDPATVPVPEKQVAQPVDLSAPLDERVAYAKSLLARYKLPGTGNYGPWIDALMAVHHHTGGSAEGLAISDAWSADQGEYAGPADVRFHWDSFGKKSSGSSITLATLERRVRDQETERMRASPEQFFDAVDPAASLFDTTYGKVPQPVAEILETIKLGTFGGLNARRILACAYHLKRWFDQNTEVLFFGDSNIGKSFLVLDILAHIALGLPWDGVRCVAGGAGTLYLTYEGLGALERRMEALRAKFPGLEKAPFAWHGMQRPMTTPEGHAELEAVRLAYAKQFGKAPDIVVIDPLRNAIGGSDSDQDLIEKFRAELRALRAQDGCATWIIHHCGHTEKRRPRGDSGITAGVDTEVCVSRSEDGIMDVTTSKQRDNEASAKKFRLEVVQLGMDDDGDLVTTCVVQPAAQIVPVVAAAAPVPTTAEKLAELDRTIMQTLIDETARGAKVTRTSLVATCYPTLKRDYVRSDIRDRIDVMVGRGYIDEKTKGTSKSLLPIAKLPGMEDTAFDRIRDQLEERFPAAAPAPVLRPAKSVAPPEPEPNAAFSGDRAADEAPTAVRVKQPTPSADTLTAAAAPVDDTLRRILYGDASAGEPDDDVPPPPPPAPKRERQRHRKQPEAKARPAVQSPPVAPAKKPLHRLVPVVPTNPQERVMAGPARKRE